MLQVAKCESVVSVKSYWKDSYVRQEVDIDVYCLQDFNVRALRANICEVIKKILI